MHWNEVTVTPPYRCPICERHTENRFFASCLVPEPICAACADYLDMACLEDSRPNDPEIEKIESITNIPWQEYRIALLQKNLATWREIEEDPEEDSIKKYMRWANWNEQETREYVRGVIRGLEESLKIAGGKLQ